MDELRQNNISKLARIGSTQIKEVEVSKSNITHII